jgi:integrase
MIRRNTGLRWSELVGLRVGDIDLAARPGRRQSREVRV